MLAELGLMQKLHTSQVALLLKLGQKPTASIYRQNITRLPKRGPLLQPSYKKTTAENSRLLAAVWSDIILHTLPGPIHSSLPGHMAYYREPSFLCYPRKQPLCSHMHLGGPLTSAYSHLQSVNKATLKIRFYPRTLCYISVQLSVSR